MLEKLIAWWKGTPVPVPVDEVREAVYRACAAAGLDADALTDKSDLKATGKLYAVLHVAAITAGKDHQLRTVGDVIDWLKEAPKA